MPIYEYECQKCGEKFEDFVWPGEDEKLLKCPKCGEEKPKKLISSISKKTGDSSCAPRHFG